MLMSQERELSERRAQTVTIDPSAEKPSVRISGLLTKSLTPP